MIDKKKLPISQKIFAYTFVLMAMANILPSYSLYKPSYAGLLLFAIGIIANLTILETFEQENKRGSSVLLSYSLLFLLLCTIQFVFNSDFLLISGTEFISLYFLFCFFLLKYEMKEYILNLFISLITCLLFFSLLEYIFHLLGYEYLLASYLDRGEDSGQFYDHGLFNVYKCGVIIPRFQSLLKEPGYLGVCAGLLLYAWKKLSKTQRFVWLLSGILSLSLAFYLLAFGSLVFNGYIMNKRNLLPYLCGVLLGILLVYSYTREIVDEMLLTRVEEYIEEGDNRTTASFQEELDRIIGSSRILYGYGRAKFYSSGYAWGNTGIKADIYKYGYVGVSILLFMSFNLLSLIKFESRIYRNLCILLLLLCYYNGDIKFAIYFWLIIFFVGDIRTNKVSVELKK